MAVSVYRTPGTDKPLIPLYPLEPRPTPISPEELADLRARQEMTRRPRVNKSRWVFADLGPHGEAARGRTKGKKK